MTENDFDKAFNAFKDELKYDESKINKSLLISKMSEMSALWRLFKRQINDYKNTIRFNISPQSGSLMNR